MTPEQTEELEALKAALKQHIEEAEKATPGPWEIEDFSIFADGHLTAKVGIAVGDCAITEANAAFIAQARTMSPLACRIALAGIDALGEDYNCEVHHIAQVANARLLSILSIWKGGEA